MAIQNHSLDRDPILTSRFWKELFSILGNKLDHICSYHAQSDGQAKVVKKYLELHLHYFTYDK